MFMHEDIWHLLANLIFFFAVAFTLADLWGRALFAAFYLASGIVAALVFALVFPNSDATLIGASGANAGVMGAFLIRQFKTRLKILYFRIGFRSIARGKLWSTYRV